MATEFKFPDVGEGIAEGVLVKWRVEEGDIVKEHDAIADIETDKAIVEMPAPRDGVILKLHHRPGDTVQVGETLVTIGERGEKAAVGGAPVMAQQKKSVSVVGQLEEAEEETKEPLMHVSKPSAAQEGKLAIPAVRRVAKELGVNLEDLTGTGKEGRITEEDVRSAGSEEPSREEKVTTIKITKKYDFYGYVDRVALKGIRKAIAANMVKSHSSAVHVTHFEEADVTDLAAHREKEKGNAAKQGVKLTYLPFIIKAVVEALKNHPYLNATMEEDEIILKKYYSIGFAVDTGDGLIVPNIKRAETKSILQTAKEIEELSEKIRSRKFDISETKGGTFTMTNVGSVGGIFATPIINPPESAILATGAIREKPVVRNGKIEIRKILPLSLSFDHRILDGGEAARFTAELKKYLEDMDFFLIEKAGE